jgi:hypothetical protein
MEELRERMARIEGAFEQMNHRMGELRWEVRIWFLLLLVVMSIYHFVG